MDFGERQPGLLILKDTLKPEFVGVFCAGLLEATVSREVCFPRKLVLEVDFLFFLLEGRESLLYFGKT